MTRQVLFSAGVVLVLAAAGIPRAAVAQPVALTGSWRAAPIPVTSGSLTDEAPQTRTGEKSPLLAALLSWIAFPGVGSFYAGNSGHGVRHVAIGVLTLGGGLTALALACNDGDCGDGAGVVPALGLLGVAAANAVWSILVAVRDAEAYNRRLGTASLELTPAVAVLLPSTSREASPAPGMRARLGVRLARLSF